MCLWTASSTRDPLQGSPRLQCKCGMLVGRTIKHLVELDLVKKNVPQWKPDLISPSFLSHWRDFFHLPSRQATVEISTSSCETCTGCHTASERASLTWTRVKDKCHKCDPLGLPHLSVHPLILPSFHTLIHFSPWLDALSSESGRISVGKSS